MKQYRGTLITLEGIDGSGKSLLAKNIAPMLEAKGYRVTLTKEPGGTSLGLALRNILQQHKLNERAEFLLFAADRAQHFQDIIIPALKDGMIVISDRMADSSLAYQGYGRGLDKDIIQQVNTWAMQGITPDVTLYLDIDPIKAAQRIVQRNEILTSFEQEKIDFWNRVRQGYETIFALRNNVIKLDATMTENDLVIAAFNKVNSALRDT